MTCPKSKPGDVVELFWALWRREDLRVEMFQRFQPICPGISLGDVHEWFEGEKPLFKRVLLRLKSFYYECCILKHSDRIYEQIVSASPSSFVLLVLAGARHDDEHETDPRVLLTFFWPHH